MIRKLLVTGYKPKQNLWLVRLNVCVMRDIRVVEISAGAFGCGALVQFYYGEDRLNRGADYDYIREHDVKRMVSELVPPMIKAELKKEDEKA